MLSVTLVHPAVGRDTWLIQVTFIVSDRGPSPPQEGEIWGSEPQSQRCRLLILSYLHIKNPCNQVVGCQSSDRGPIEFLGPKFTHKHSNSWYSDFKIGIQTLKSVY